MGIVKKVSFGICLRLTGLIMILFYVDSVVSADDAESLNKIYHEFFAETPSLEALSANYSEHIIHVGKPNARLIHGKDAFIQANISPMVKMIHAGQVKLTGAFHIIRREIGESLANDVGYFHTKLHIPGQPVIESVQKFSWVFKKQSGAWLVITDFDATPASIEALEDLAPVISIGNLGKLD